MTGEKIQNLVKDFIAHHDVSALKDDDWMSQFSRNENGEIVYGGGIE